MHGIVLSHREMNYEDMAKIGRVTIEQDKHGVRIVVDGFEFKEAETCRTHVTKAMAWARDVLTTAVHADRLVPGGTIISIRGMDQEGLEKEKSSQG